MINWKKINKPATYKVGSISLIIFCILIVVSCDIVTPQKKFRLAEVQTDYFYSFMAGHLVPFLEKKGYSIEIIPAKNVIEANEMVANGRADLTFINNHSLPITDSLSLNASNLRTVVPLASRLFFVFTKEKLPEDATIRELMTGKNIGMESINDELSINLKLFLDKAKISHNKFVTYSDAPDVIVYWGTFYGVRASRLINEGWRPFSFKQNWINFMTLNEPALKPYQLPAIPGDSSSRVINTIATRAILVTNSEIGENAIYELASTILHNRVELFRNDIMYRSITENFDRNELLYPLHEGTTSFLIREQPTFLERYADALALIFSIILVIYGTIQALRNRIARKKKDRVDLYFIDFLEIRSNKIITGEERIRLLDNLFQRAVEQLTNEKLDKSDFHILSRLIQQELTMIKFNSR